MTTNAALYIATNYPDYQQRNKIEELDLANKGLKGDLHFAELGFNNLKRIDLTNNQLTSLVLTNPGKIDYLNISNNQISKLDISQSTFSGIEDVARGINFFEFSNNSFSLTVKKTLLKSRWYYWKDLEKHYSDLLSPRILDLVDSSDLDKFITDYDFSKEGDIEYHKLLGGSYNQLDEIGLQQLAQQLLARCLIKQNQLINGDDERYDEEISTLAQRFQKTSSLYIQYSLDLIQRSVDRELRGSLDLEKEFQNKLTELEALLNPDRTPNYFNRAVDFQEVKKKIWDLQDTIQNQQKELIQLKKDLRDKETARRSLAENYQASEVEKAEIKNTADNLKKTSKELTEQLGAVEQSLKTAEEHLQRLRGVNTSLEDNNDNLATIQGNLNKLLEDKEKHITHLKDTTNQLQQEKKTAERQLQQLTSQEQARKDYWGKVRQWGIIGVILLIIGLGSYYLWTKFKN